MPIYSRNDARIPCSDGRSAHSDPRTSAEKPKSFNLSTSSTKSYSRKQNVNTPVNLIPPSPENGSPRSLQEPPRRLFKSDSTTDSNSSKRPVTLEEENGNSTSQVSIHRISPSSEFKDDQVEQTSRHSHYSEILTIPRPDLGTILFLKYWFCENFPDYISAPFMTFVTAGMGQDDVPQFIEILIEMPALIHGFYVCHGREIYEKYRNQLVEIYTIWRFVQVSFGTSSNSPSLVGHY